MISIVHFASGDLKPTKKFFFLLYLPNSMADLINVYCTTTAIKHDILSYSLKEGGVAIEVQQLNKWE